MGLGETAALSAAALWAFSSVLYTRVNLQAWQINFVKIVLASLILGVQLAIVSRFSGTAFIAAPGWAWGWLAASGFVGLVIGDTCYFRCLQILGVRRCLVLTTTAPIFTAILGWVFLGEVLAPVAIVGVAVTVLGVAMVVNDRSTKGDEPGLYPGSVRLGVAYGLAAALCQAIGAVAARHAMTECNALEAAFARLSTSAVMCLAVLVCTGRLTKTLKSLANSKVILRLLPAVICGTWLGVWFSQIAFQKLIAANAQTLLSTSPLFVIPAAWLLTRKRPTSQVLLGAVIAVAGVFLIFR